MTYFAHDVLFLNNSIVVVTNSNALIPLAAAHSILLKTNSHLFSFVCFLLLFALKHIIAIYRNKRA